MKLKFVAAFASATLALPVLVACTTAVAQQAPTPVAKAAEPVVTYRTHIAPLLKAQCAECHGDDAPTLAEFKLNEEGYKKDKLGPRTDTYADLLQIVAYPDHGALMRRLDDGTNTPDKKPGNMYKKLGETEAERAANLKMIKAWVGEGAWNLNRWKAKGDVPGITKEQLDKLQLKY
jgi:mono/diheme cytochrome c family protein